MSGSSLGIRMPERIELQFIWTSKVHKTIPKIRINKQKGRCAACLAAPGSVKISAELPI